MHLRFETSDINLAAYLITAGFQVEILYSPNKGKSIFEFHETRQLRNAIIAFERGAVVCAKSLLLTRTHLYHEASRIAVRGRQ